MFFSMFTRLGLKTLVNKLQDAKLRAQGLRLALKLTGFWNEDRLLGLKAGVYLLRARATTCVHVPHKRIERQSGLHSISGTFFLKANK